MLQKLEISFKIHIWVVYVIYCIYLFIGNGKGGILEGENFSNTLSIKKAIVKTNTFFAIGL